MKCLKIRWHVFQMKILLQPWHTYTERDGKCFCSCGYGAKEEQGE